MNTSPWIPGPTFRRIATTALVLAPASIAFAQSFSFDGGNDKGWTRYEPLKAFGIGANFTFPNRTYRIQMDPPPDPATFGPARAGSFFPSGTFSKVQVEAEIAGWDDSLVQSLGVVARVGSLGLGTTSGYTFNYNPRSGFHQINLVLNEQPSSAVNESMFRLNPDHRYRFVFTAVGPNLLGRVYSITNLAVPIHSVAGREETHTSGRTGLFAFAIEDTSRIDARFANFAVSVPTRLRAAFLDAAPASGEVFTEPAANMVVRLANLETSVRTDSIRLEVDGASAPFELVDLDPILILTHTPASPLDPSKTHTGTIRFADGEGEQTVAWSFGVPVSGPTLLVANRLEGPFTADPSVIPDAASKSLTLQVPDGTRYYRLSGPDNPVIESFRVDGDVLRLEYR